MSQFNRSAPASAPYSSAPANGAAAAGAEAIPGMPGPKPRATKTSGLGITHVEWKDVENLRRMMSPNGKILSRKRLGSSAREQRMIGQAIKRARFMALLPYTSATL
jgi:small subunit ribosomal protein S18